MACEKCNDLCIRFVIETPSDLRQAIEMARQSVEAATITVLLGAANPVERVTFAELAAGHSWEEVVNHRFRCNSCGEIFSLLAETHHGRGGHWAPENKAAIRQ